VRLSPLGTAANTGLLYQPQIIDDGDYGAISGMKIGRGNWGTRRKPAPVTLYPPQIPHDQTRARARAARRGGKPQTNGLCKKLHSYMRFRGSRCVNIKIMNFWGVKPTNLVDKYKCSRRKCRQHLQGEILFLSWRWRPEVPRNRWHLPVYTDLLPRKPQS
jgi:hypothetical protein